MERVSFLIFISLFGICFAGGDEEDEGFSKWDGIGLGVAVGGLILFCGGLYLKEFVFCPHESRIHPTAMSERDHESIKAKIAIPNKEALEHVYVELMETLDTNDNYTLDKKELQKLFTSEETKEILRQYDLDKTGDISVWELRAYYQEKYGGEDKAEAALEKLKKGESEEDPKREPPAEEPSQPTEITISEKPIRLELAVRTTPNQSKEGSEHLDHSEQFEPFCPPSYFSESVQRLSVKAARSNSRSRGQDSQV